MSLSNIEIIPGGIKIGIGKSGCVGGTATTPAPFVTEAERLKVFEEARIGFIVRGWIVVSCRRVRNKAFDQRGEKTSMVWKFRAPKNRNEAEGVLSEILRISVAESERAK